MTRPNQTVFICIAGAFCPGSFFSEVVSGLKNQGFEAQYTELPTMDVQLKAQGHLPSMYEDSAHIRSLCLFHIIQGRNVILVANSYGGIVASEACRGIVPNSDHGSTWGKLQHLILLGSLLAVEGLNVDQLLSKTKATPGSSQSSQNGTATWLSPRDPAEMGRLLCGSLPLDQQLVYGRLTKEMCSNAKSVPATFEGWKIVPTTMVISTSDVALPVQAQEDSFAEAHAAGYQNIHKVILDGADHASMLTNPKEIIEICLDVAKSSTK